MINLLWFYPEQFSHEDEPKQGRKFPVKDNSDYILIILDLNFDYKLIYAQMHIYKSIKIEEILLKSNNPL